MMPVTHLISLRRYAQGPTVPVLLDDNKAVQGSSQIIDYLDYKYPSPALTPENAVDRQLCLEIEQTVDKKIGESIRQIFYFRLHAYPLYLRHCFTHSMPLLKRFFFPLVYPLVRSRIYNGYVISDSSVAHSRREFEIAMSEIENALKQNQYLVGNTFSRADLSVASMLSMLVMPSQHPFPWIDIPDAETRTYYEEYDDHPVTHWVKTMYQNHR
jgi:glutathione S-transferase